MLLVDVATLRNPNVKLVTVHPKAVKKLRNFYLWVFADELIEKPRQSYPGEVVRVANPDGDILGTGFYHPNARVALRMISRKEVQPDADFWSYRLKQSIDLRKPLRCRTNAVRLVYSEGDYLPGLIVDDFNGHLVVQFRTAGMTLIKPLLVTLLSNLLSPDSIFERSDVEYLLQEGLKPFAGQLTGDTPNRAEIHEDGVRFFVDIKSGQKTGFFIDQRDGRYHFARHVEPGMNVLDAFCYTGGFGIHAARKGANVTAVDKDGSVLELADENARLNDISARFLTIRSDLFQWLPQSAEKGMRFDAISLDPPALIKYKNQQGKGRGLLMDLIRPCLQMLRPGGMLHLSTCAYHLSPALAKEAIRLAAGDVGKRLRMLAETIQSTDHPYIVQMPETLYLRGYTLQVAED